MRSIRHGLSAVVALAVAAAALGACDEAERRPQEPRASIRTSGAVPFEPPSYPDGRGIDTIASARVGRTGGVVFVVGSRNDSVAQTGGSRIDLVEAFAYDSLRSAWTRVLSDSVEGAERLELRDATGDGHDDIVVRLTQGGNDPVSTSGMNIYSADGGALRRVFRSTWMDPHLDTLDGIVGPVITVHRALWPLFAPRADALVFVDDVFGFRDGRFRSIIAVARAHFRAAARRAVERYRPLRDSIDRQVRAARRADAARRDSLQRLGIAENDGARGDSLSYEESLRLYQACALVLINDVKSGDERAARAFWIGQREFLRSVLPDEQFDELAAFSERLITAG
jgi:hypothetical protein